MTDQGRAEEVVTGDERIDYLMRVFGLSKAAALDTIDLLTNDARIDELGAGMEATIKRLIAMRPEQLEETE